MSHPILKRYVLADDHLDLSGKVQHWHGEIINGKYLCWVMASDAQLAELADVKGVLKVFSSLEADADKQDPTTLATLAKDGIVPKAGDRVLNTLRAWRDKDGSKLDISNLS